MAGTGKRRKSISATLKRRAFERIKMQVGAGTEHTTVGCQTPQMPLISFKIMRIEAAVRLGFVAARLHRSEADLSTYNSFSGIDADQVPRNRLRR